MPLIFHELIHVSLSILAAYIFFLLYQVTGISFISLLFTALVSGVLIDADHLFDYYMAYGWKFNLRKFFKGDEFNINKRIYVLFHGYEYVFLIILMGFIVENEMIKPYIFTFAVSSLFHLLFDVKVNKVLFRTYSILYRIHSNFNIKKLTIHK